MHTRNPYDVLTAALVSRAVAGAGLGDASVVIQQLEPEARKPVVRDAGRSYAAASMIKVPIAAALTSAWARGQHDPSERLRIGASVMTDTDAASPLRPGYEATLEELGRLMLVRSDNVATNALIERLDRTRITAYMSELGLRKTIVRRKLTGGDIRVLDPGAEGRNAHPPADAARLFEHVACGTVPGAAWIGAQLAAQEFNDMLSAGLEPGDRFAHKTGGTSEASHDGGILETSGGRRYVVVVYSALPSGPGSDARFAAFMRTVRPALGD